MSIAQLKLDLKAINSALPGRETATAPEVVDFLKHNLLPWLESQADEVGEMDESIEDLVHQNPDILHSATATVFAGIIEGAVTLVNELKTRIGDDRRLLSLIKEWHGLVAEGREILEEITLDDPDDEDDDDEAEDVAATAPAAESKPV